MREKFKVFSILFTCQVVAYALLVMNYRAVSQANIPHTLMTDGIYASLNYFVIKKIAKDDSHFIGWFGYFSGSLFGSYVGILMSKYLLGH